MEVVAFTTIWKLNTGRTSGSAHEARIYEGLLSLSVFGIAVEWAKKKASNLGLRVTTVEGVASDYKGKKKLLTRPQELDMDIEQLEAFRSLVDYHARQCLEGAHNYIIGSALPSKLTDSSNYLVVPQQNKVKSA